LGQDRAVGHEAPKAGAAAEPQRWAIGTAEPVSARLAQPGPLGRLGCYRSSDREVVSVVRRLAGSWPSQAAGVEEGLLL